MLGKDYISFDRLQMLVFDEADQFITTKHDPNTWPEFWGEGGIHSFLQVAADKVRVIMASAVHDVTDRPHSTYWGVSAPLTRIRTGTYELEFVEHQHIVIQAKSNPIYEDPYGYPHLLSTYGNLQRKLPRFMQDDSSYRIFCIFANTRKDIDDLETIFIHGRVSRDCTVHLLASDHTQLPILDGTVLAETRSFIFRIHDRCGLEETTARLARRLNTHEGNRVSIILATGICQSGWSQDVDVVVHSRVPSI
jgi:hypothetical protein